MFHRLILHALPAVADPGAADRLQYNRDIRPMLSDDCFSCHGPDARHRKTGLRLDVRGSAVARDASVPSSTAAGI